MRKIALGMAVVAALGVAAFASAEPLGWKYFGCYTFESSDGDLTYCFNSIEF